MSNIITISREFGSGGREIGRRITDTLGYDYYDREIITAIAERQKLDTYYVERALENNHLWRMIPLTFRRSFSSPSVMRTAQTSLLLEQKQVIEQIGKSGRNCVIVGRNADVLLKNERPFTVFVCADMESRIERCVKRAERGEQLSQRESKSVDGKIL